MIFTAHAPGRMAHGSALGWQRLRKTVAGWLCIGLFSPLFAWALPPAPASGSVPTDAAALVRRIQQAAAHHSFTGIFVVSAGTSINSLRITHVGGGHEQIDRIETLDGPARQIYRHNGLVHVLWPDSHVASVEHHEFEMGYPAALQSNAAVRLDMYDLQPAGVDRIAGMEADVLQLRPRDAYRYGRKLWLERRSGLLLRTDILGERGEVVESAGFSELHWDTRLQPQALLKEMHRLKGYRVERQTPVLTDLAREGWTLNAAIPGFQVVKTYRLQTGLSARGGGSSSQIAAHSVPAIDTRPAPGDVLQAVFGDGLTTVSVFIERFDPARHPPEAPSVNHRATHLLTRRVEDWRITVVGDVPLGTLQQFAARMTRQKS